MEPIVSPFSAWHCQEWMENYQLLSSCSNDIFLPNSEIAKIVLSLVLLAITLQRGNPGILMIYLTILYPLVSVTSLLRYICWSCLWFPSILSISSSFTLSFIISVMLTINLSNLSILPATGWLLVVRYCDSDKFSSWFRTIVFILVVVAISCSCSFEVDRAFNNNDKNIYQPSFGVVWYANAVVFPEYKSYLTGLFSCLPTVSSLIVSMTLSGYSKKDFSIVMKILLLVNLYFLECIPAIDIMYVLIALMDHTSVFTEMRYPLWALSLFVISLLVQPILVDIWVRTGSGNANYVFFVGFFSWAMLGLFIVELIGACIRIRTDERNRS